MSNSPSRLSPSLTPLHSVAVACASPRITQPRLDLRPALHLLLHILVPLAVALLFYRRRWFSAWLWMMAGWLIDIDHLWADPVYVPDRCSIGFHPLHRPPAIAVYCLLLLPRRTRLLAIGLLIHIGLDAVDCMWMRVWD